MEREAKNQSVKAKRIATIEEHYSIPSDSLTLTQAAKEYHRSESGIANAINRGKLQSEKIGPYRLIKRNDLERYFEWAAQARKESAYRAMKARCNRINACTN